MRKQHLTLLKNAFNLVKPETTWFHKTFVPGFKKDFDMVACYDEKVSKMIGCALIDIENNHICALGVHPAYDRTDVTTSLIQNCADYFKDTLSINVPKKDFELASILYTLDFDRVIGGQPRFEKTPHPIFIAPYNASDAPKRLAELNKVNAIG